MIRLAAATALLALAQVHAATTAPLQARAAAEAGRTGQGATTWGPATATVAATGPAGSRR
ncbi:hypothetical protein [Prosthecomicrobium sp. N25]|uniref:hypothetical protein n=1 Tax=Prosthecomicrobium sp. N25 TaxID=3129254 RepID=UPI0030787956